MRFEFDASCQLLAKSTVSAGVEMRLFNRAGCFIWERTRIMASLIKLSYCCVRTSINNTDLEQRFIYTLNVILSQFFFWYKFSVDSAKRRFEPALSRALCLFWPLSLYVLFFFFLSVLHVHRVSTVRFPPYYYDNKYYFTTIDHSLDMQQAPGGASPLITTS